jgi:hypothetical protein
MTQSLLDFICRPRRIYQQSHTLRASWQYIGVFLSDSALGCNPDDLGPAPEEPQLAAGTAKSIGTCPSVKCVPESCGPLHPACRHDIRALSTRRRVGCRVCWRSWPANGGALGWPLALTPAFAESSAAAPPPQPPRRRRNRLGQPLVGMAEASSGKDRRTRPRCAIIRPVPFKKARGPWHGTTPRALSRTAARASVARSMLGLGPVHEQRPGVSAARRRACQGIPNPHWLAWQPAPRAAPRTTHISQGSKTNAF